MLHNMTDYITNTTADSGDQKPDTSISSAIWSGRVGIYGIGGTAIIVFGLIANAVSIAVLSRYRQKSSAPLLLIILALFDSILLFSELMLETLPTLVKGGLLPISYTDWIRTGYVLFFSVPKIAQTGTTYMTVLITIERYVAVAKPFMASRICRKSVALKVSAAILIWSVVYRLPFILAYTRGYKTDENNITKVILIRTDFGNGDFYNTAYVIWMNVLVELVAPCSVLVVLNVLLLLALKSSSFMPPTTNSRPDPRNTEHRLTAMVLSVTLVFFICELFSATSMVIIRRKNLYSECSVDCNNFLALSDTMIIVNSASNFFLYCAVGRRFREIFMEMFCGRILKRKSRESSKTTYTSTTIVSKDSSKVPKTIRSSNSDADLGSQV